MVSIVIPAYNEEKAVGETVAACLKALEELPGQGREVVVVDDGSSDGTADAATRAGAKVVRNVHNMGYGYSVKRGIRHAANDTIVIADADGTYPVNKIPELVREYNNGFDMVVAARQGRNYDESFSKKMFRKLLKALVEFTSGRSVPDINSGLRVFSGKIASSFFPTLCDGFSFTTSLTLAYLMTSKFVVYVPVEYHKRTGKTKVKFLRDSLRTLQFVVEAILFYNPIKIFLTFCVFLVVLAGINVAGTIIWQLTSLYILSIGCVLLSILMFGLGLLAILLKQILHRSVGPQSPPLP